MRFINIEELYFSAEKAVRKFFVFLKAKFFSKYGNSKAEKHVRHIEALGYYYHHIWIRSKLRKKLIILWSESIKPYILHFNLLNFIFKWSAVLCWKIGLKKQGDWLDSAMVDRTGLNRHVFYRYLLKELFLYFFVFFLFFFFIFFCNHILLIIQKVIEKKVPLWDVMWLMIYALPGIIAQSAPFATLVGFLVCLGRLASENEILIFRASGHSYKTILIPVVSLGLLISLGSFFVNDYLIPLGTIKYNKLYYSILHSNPAVELESHSVKKTIDKTLVIGEVNGEKVSDLIFFDTGSEDEQRIIVADSSVVKKSTDPGVLMTLDMDNSTVVLFDKSKRADYDVLTSDKMSLNVFESSIMDFSRNTSPREMTFYDLNKKIREMEKEPGMSKKRINSFKVELNKKFSLPFGSIFFAFLALPLALIFGKHNGQTIGLIIGIIISLLYWTVMVLGQIFGNRGGLSGFWVMWFPNILIFIAASIFYLKLVRK